jgi:hypothetical protein
VEFLAELLAFFSGAILLRPAIRINGVLRDSADLRAILEKSTAKVDHETIPAIRQELEKLSSSWDKWDDRCLKWGVGLFALSGLIKLLLVWNKS